MSITSTIAAFFSGHAVALGNFTVQTRFSRRSKPLFEQRSELFTAKTLDFSSGAGLILLITKRFHALIFPPSKAFLWATFATSCSPQMPLFEQRRGLDFTDNQAVSRTYFPAVKSLSLGNFRGELFTAKCLCLSGGAG
ncbi:MAG: hypothetical protein ACI4JZ_07620 [Oscillospiraceae bacterium]